MKDVELVIPSKKYLESYLEACQELADKPELRDTIFHNPDEFDDWKDNIFLKFEEQRCGINLPEMYVPESTFWLVEGGIFIGEGSIRHSLTPVLERFGGHIGYAIRPSKWSKGYGTILLKLLLDKAHELGIKKALITCNEDNVGSCKVIEKNDGVFQDTIDYIIDDVPRRTNRYWIEIIK